MATGDTPKSLIDDPDFLSQIDSLDRKPSAGSQWPAGVPWPPPEDAPLDVPILVARPPVSVPVAAPPPPTQAAPVQAASRAAAPDVSLRRRRPLLDVFPADGLRARVGPAAVSVSPAAAAGQASSFADPGVDAYFGFRVSPFAAEPTAAFFFSGRSHYRALQQSVSALGRGERLVVVTGEPGLGKSMLCQTIAAVSERSLLTAYLPAPPRSTGALLADLLWQFGLAGQPASGHAETLSTARQLAVFRQFCLSLGPIGARAVVLLDDAEGATAGVVEQLNALAADPALPFALVLAGAPALSSRLPPAVGPERGRQPRLVLEPLGRDEVGAYVTHRLAVAGGGPDLRFAPEAIEALWAGSQGTPRLLNDLCRQALGRACTASSRVVTAEMVTGRAARPVDARSASPRQIVPERVPESAAGGAVAGDESQEVSSVSPRRAPDGARARPGVARQLAAAAALVAMTVAGAGLSAWVFQDRVRVLAARWHAGVPGVVAAPQGSPRPSPVPSAAPSAPVPNPR